MDPESETPASGDDGLLLDSTPADDQPKTDDKPEGGLLDDKPEGDQPDAETKPEGEGGEAEGEKDDEDKPEGAPEEYAEFTAPEGVELNADMLDRFKAFAKENNLSQERAQALVDMGAEIVKNADAKLADLMVEARAEWRKQTLDDTEYGGAAWQSSLPVAKAALDRFGTPELKEVLAQSGLGDHPEVIRYFYRVGKATGEHDFVKSGKTDAAKGSFYDHPTSKAI